MHIIGIKIILRNLLEINADGFFESKLSTIY